MREQHQEQADPTRSRPAPAPAVDAAAPAWQEGVFTPQALLHLQRTVGNAAVAHLVEERRQPHSCGDDCGHDRPVQRSALPGVLRSPGRPLDDGTRADMEARFGADFSDVRLHTDPAARASAAEVGARAYTSGNHVVIGDGGADRHTLAHELTHVVQQRSGPVAGTDRGDGVRVSDPGDRFEREAEANATRVLASDPTTHPGRPPAEQAGHAVRPGAAVQRVVHGTAAQQEAQRNQLDDLVAMWVPDEAFDEDGNPIGPSRSAAYVARRAGHGVDAVRVERNFVLPPRMTTRSGHRLVEDWVIEYQTSFFTYRIQAINDRQRQRSLVMIDLNGPFEFVRVPKGSRGRSMGRPYRFGDYWDVNPDFLRHLPGDPDESLRVLIEGRGLEEENRVTEADRGSLVQLPSDEYEPFLFYTRDITDPSFTHRDGTRKDDRRFLLPAHFDSLAEQARPAGRTRAQVGVSQPPVAGRQDAGRNPAPAMGNFQAHHLMPESGRPRTDERLASHEWCHLIGDNDGGPTAFHNLVIGTNAVNTEQLAMESALRDFRPRMEGLGYAIRLRVEAIVERAEAESPVVPGGPYQKADWISFAIDLVDKDPSAGPVDTRPSVEYVHRQIMDANRGTITESEFTSLHNQVRNQLRAAHGRLKEQRQRAAQAQPGSPMAVD